MNVCKALVGWVYVRGREQLKERDFEMPDFVTAFLKNCDESDFGMFVCDEIVGLSEMCYEMWDEMCFFFRCVFLTFMNNILFLWIIMHILPMCWSSGVWCMYQTPHCV